MRFQDAEAVEEPKSTFNKLSGGDNMDVCGCDRIAKVLLGQFQQLSVAISVS